MDTRRPPTYPPPPHHPPPPATHPSHPTHYQPPPPPPQHAVDQRPAPPTFPQSHPPAVAHQQPPPPPPPPPHQYAPFQPQHPAAPGPNLPPIHPPSQHASHQLPSLQQHHPPPPAPPPYELRDVPPEHHPYPPQNRSNQATPAPVSRTYSFDSSHQQRTPTTPVQPGSAGAPYPPAPDTGPPQHHSHQPPPGQPMEHGGHHGYPPTNGVSHGLPLPHHHPHGPPPHHEPPPQYMTPTQEHHQPYPPPPSSVSQGMYASGPYGPTSQSYASVAKRKQMRATQACEQCRQRKQKCDEGNPCSFCKENSLNCQYRDTPPAKTDKNMERLLQYMENHSKKLEELSSKIQHLDSRIQGVEHSSVPLSDDPAPVREHPMETPLPHDIPIKQDRDLDDHRTAPHKLILLWPSVRPLLNAAHVKIKDSYVMEAEDRGILRIWTRGEGIDEYDGTHIGAPSSPARSEESGDGNAPSPPYGVWGTGFPRTPTSDASRSEPSTLGGLKPDGSLDLDAHTIYELYESYIIHMHVMHPFLDKHRLKRLVDNFVQRYCGRRPLAPFAVGGNSDNERPLKRQRSNGSTAVGAGHEHGGARYEPTERSPGNAIVWLVLALGKICQHKEPLDFPTIGKGSNANMAIAHTLTGTSGVYASSPISAAIKPNEMSPQSTPTTQPTPSSMDGTIRAELHSRRPSMDGTLSSSKARNLDVIPGLAYYAKAAEIMGDQGDGNDLVHLQMFLLAGLYKGQLARVRESMSWFTMAGRAAKSLLDRYQLYTKGYWQGSSRGDIKERHGLAQARIKDKRRNLIVLASWTCLQLESDILAELRLPSSGISNVEDMLPMPHNLTDNERGDYEDIKHVHESEDENDRLLIYVAQMFLRKRLNKIHKEMYGDDCLNQTLEDVTEMLEGHEDVLGRWRRTLPPSQLWNDNDPLPSDILAARLRAKYWGARYLVNRPFLDYALHIMPHVKDGHAIETVARDCNGNMRDKAEIHLFKAIERMGDEVVWKAVGRCIDAAMHSTVAFDGVPDRLIVTNIHGTAHAQFGNMLVLSAAYYTPWLKAFVDTERFEKLLSRTVTFLRRLARISPTCAIDCQILEKVSFCIFGAGDQKHVYHNEVEPPSGPHSTTNSFGHST